MTPLPTGGASAFQDDTPGMSEPYLVRLLHTSPVRPDNEVRALWVVRDALRSVETVDRMVDFAVQSRFQLLFVQVRGRGDAYYRSSMEPPAADLDMPITDFDPLEYLLVRAHRAGISVPAWVNVFLVWSDPTTAPPEGHVVSRHPEWLLSSPQGERMDERSVRWALQSGIEGYYLSPALPAVRRYVAAVIRDIVTRYPVDGIHLDYVRYPGRGYTYGRDERTRFALEWGIDPGEVGADRARLAGVLGERVVTALDSVYVERRAGDVDSTVAAIRGVVGDLPLSAAVVADAVQGRVEKGQDWAGWVHGRLVDFVVPMAYTYSPLEIEQRLRSFQRVVGRDRLLIGLALFDGRDQELFETIPLIRHENARGYALFSYNVLAGNPYAAALLEEALFANIESDSSWADGDADPDDAGPYDEEPEYDEDEP
jgi:uncharacterized lipoprotein YddW (UPF0748 family)